MKLTEKEFIDEIDCEDKCINRLRIFDFDDTLITSESKVKIFSQKNNVEYALSAKQFAEYVISDDDVVDHSEFDKLINHREISMIFNILKKSYKTYGSAANLVLSARNSSIPIFNVMKENAMSDLEIISSSTSLLEDSKARIIEEIIDERKLQHVEFFDDSSKNIHYVLKLKQKRKDVRLIINHIKHVDNVIAITRFS